MELTRFNTARVHEAAALVRACAHVDRWVDEVVARRPYATVDDVVAAMWQCADPWTEAEIDSALTRHPRIGERARGSDSDAQMSRSEQAGVGDDAGVRARLAAGNAEYEARFGHVFLIRAAGRSAEEILAALTERLTHAPEEERQITAKQLREIATLRMRRTLT